MSDAATTQPNLDTNDKFQSLAPRVFKIGLIVGLVGIFGGFLTAGEGSRGMLSYLTAFCFYLSISLGALFFVVVQHLTRAGWSVVIRRIAECMSMNLVLLAMLAVPLIYSAYAEGGIYHHWSDMAKHMAHNGYDEVLAGKQVWLNPTFWSVRVVIYFALTIFIAWFYWSNSVKQDRDGARIHTLNMQKISGLWLGLIALTITFVSFDFIMSLDPHWYSTMFGVYFFGGGFLGFFAIMVIVCRFLQSRGILTDVITIEHYHDLGKWMLAFTFFWGYIAFSQYMLIWYASIPEEMQWFARRGATTHNDELVNMGGWSTLSVLLIFCHLFLPFLALLTRWTKRKLIFITILASWLLLFHFLDLYWQIMPELSNNSELVEVTTIVDGTEVKEMIERKWAPYGPGFLPELLMWIGMGGLWFGGLAAFAKSNALVPTGDPRLSESLAFENW